MTALHHELAGPPDAPVLVLSNSLGTTLAMWDPQLPALTERFRVLRYDHRGHGRSAVPPGPYTIADLGQDALALLDDLGIERFSWCGLSLGGMVGMWLAAHTPDRVDRLALFCTSALLGPPEMWVERAAAVRKDGTRAQVDGATARWFTPAFVEGEPQTVARTTGMLADTPDEGYAGCCEAIAAMDLTADLPAIRARTLVVAGTDDPATPPEHGRRIAEGIPGARMAVVPDVAHLAAIERPRETTELLLDHLTG